MSTDNLLSERWTGLDSDELRLLLRERFGGGLGQYDGDDGKLYLPLARDESRIVLTFVDNKIAAVEPGEAFDRTEWQRVSREINDVLGFAGRPMQRPDIDRKFRGNISTRWPREKTDAVLQSLWVLENTQDIGALLAALAV